MDLNIADDTATVAISGDIDASNDDQLRHVLWEAIDTEPDHLVLDLRDADMFGTTGVNATVWTWHLLRDSQTDIVLRDCRPLTRRVLSICRIAELERVSLAPSQPPSRDRVD